MNRAPVPSPVPARTDWCPEHGVGCIGHRAKTRVAQPDYARLGLGSAIEAEGRN